MNIYPKLYLEKVTDITIEALKENNIKGLILDVDNTLIDIDRKMIDGLVEWKNNLEKNNIKFIILSNSNKKDKVETVAKNLNISYLGFAKKPFKSGFKKAAEKLNLENEKIGVVGDQIFTDVIGANRCNMFSILVKPISEKDLLITKWKRPLENKIIQKFLNKQNTKD
jgi:HAD superfamily phosphatase (TIGR01668 family)